MDYQSKNKLPMVAPPLGKKQYITYSQETLDHWITDGELDQLNELRKDNVVEIFWGSLGVFLGSVFPAFDLYEKMGNAANPIDLKDAFLLSVCGVSFLMTIIMALFWRQRSIRATSLTDKIRNRPKAPVGGPDGPIQDHE